MIYKKNKADKRYRIILKFTMLNIYSMNTIIRFSGWEAPLYFD